MDKHRAVRIIALEAKMDERLFGYGDDEDEKKKVNVGQAVNTADFSFVPPGGQPVGTFPVTGGNRSGNLAITANALDALLFGVPGASSLAPGIFGLSGVFTDPQFQVVVRALNQKKGVDLLSAPRVTTKSGQRAVIEIVREFRYPTQFDPPKIPDTVGSTNGQAGGTSSVPITPTTPTGFETRNIGVTLEANRWSDQMA